MSDTAISLGTGIAIVGMSCRIADAEGIDDFWQKLLSGHDSCREVPEDVFRIDDYTSPTNKNGNHTSVRIGNWLTDSARWGFDAAFFGATDEQALSMDPEHRLALTVTHEALESAGYSAAQGDDAPATSRFVDGLDPTRTGVFFASTCDDYRENLLPGHVDGRFASSISRQYLVHRIQKHWGLGGPAKVVDTVCNSSLVALDVACTSIARGECDNAIVGGVNIITQPLPTIGLATDHFLSETGTCKTFDAAADGYSRGEAIGVVVIKRYEDAQRDKDNVLGTLLSIGTNHSGDSISLTFPHMPAQLALMRSNLNAARIDPRQVTLAEAHGTGTQAGDPCELEAIRTAFAPEERGVHETLAVTTNKSNFGHSESSSGICSLIKSLLQIHTGIVPPHVGVRTTFNPALEHLTVPPVHIATGGVASVPVCRKQPFAVTCVNNFGAAGGNSTLLLKGEEKRSIRKVVASGPAQQLVFLSAKTEAALVQWQQALRRACQGGTVLLNEPDLADLSFTTVARRPHYPVRKAIVADSIADLVQKMSSSFSPQRPLAKGKVVISLPSESLIRGFNEELRTCPSFCAAFNEVQLVAAATRKCTSWHGAALHSYAFAKMLLQWGIVVQACHQGGELARLAAAGEVTVDKYVEGEIDTGAYETAPQRTAFSFIDNESFRSQITQLLAGAFERGEDLLWDAVQADLNTDALACPLPTYAFEFKRFTVPYTDLGIVTPTWGESPKRVQRSATDPKPLIHLGNFPARQVTSQYSEMAFELELKGLDGSDFVSAFSSIAIGAAYCCSFRANQAERVAALSSICFTNIAMVEDQTMLCVSPLAAGGFQMELRQLSQIPQKVLASAIAQTLAPHDLEWDALQTFVAAVPQSATQQVTSKIALRILGKRSSHIDISKDISLGADGCTAVLRQVSGDLSHIVRAAMSMTTLLANQTRCSPGQTQMEATLAKVTASRSEAKQVTLVASMGRTVTRIFVLHCGCICGEIQASCKERSIKSTDNAKVSADKQDVAGGHDKGPTVSSAPHSLESAGSNILKAAARIIEAEVGVDVTLAENVATSFASIGVDSLMSLLLLDRMREVVPFELPRSLFFDYDDWSALSAFLTSGESGQDVRDEDTVMAAACRSGDNSSRPDDEVASNSTQAPTCPSTFSTVASSISTTRAGKLSIGTLKDVEHAVSFFDSCLLGTDKSATLGERGINAVVESSIRERVEENLQRALFRPSNTLEDVSSMLRGPIHASAMVRRASLLSAGEKMPGSQTLFLVPDGSGSAAVFNTIPPTTHTVYALNSPFLGDRAPEWHDGVVEIAAAYITQMREKQPKGPYVFGGWSFGGIVSYEMTRQLLAEGEEIAGVFLLDAPCPQHLPPLPSEILAWGQENGSLHGHDAPRFPPALLRHFEHAIDSLHDYAPPSLADEGLVGIPPTMLLTAADGVDCDPSIVPNTNSTVSWLFGERKSLGPQGWDRLFGPGRVDCADITGNHFTMMEPEHASMWWRVIEETVRRWNASRAV